MAKKLMAVLAALTMCAAMAGCGNKTESNESSAASKAEASSSAAEESSVADSSSEEDSVADSADSSSADSSSADADSSKADDKDSGNGGGSNGDTASDVTTPTQAIGDFNTKLVNKNIIYQDQFGLEQQPTDGELAKMVEVAMTQYKAAQKQDMKAFIDSFNLEIARKPMMDLVDVVYGIEDEDELYAAIEEMETKYEVLDEISILLMLIGGDDAIYDIVNVEDPEPKEMRKLINALYDSLDADREDLEEKLDTHTIWTDDLSAVEENDNTTYAVLIYEYEKYDGEMYCHFDMLALDGKYEHYLDDVVVWCVDGKYGVYVQSAGAFEFSEYASMTPQQVYDEMVAELKNASSHDD